MKVTKYEEKVLKLLNERGLQKESKRLNRESKYWNPIKLGLAYSASVLTIGVGGYIGGNAISEFLENRPAVEIYDANVIRMKKLDDMQNDMDSFYAANINKNTMNILMKSNEDITAKLVETHSIVEKQNETLAKTSEYVFQREDKSKAKEKSYFGMAIIIIGGFGLKGSDKYRKKLDKNDREKREILDNYLN